MNKVPTTDTTICLQAKIRRALLTAPKLTRTLQSGRAVFRFGPWRHAARALIRMAHPPHEEAVADDSALLQINTTRVVEALRTDGIAMAGTLPPEVLNPLRAIIDELPPGEYGEFDEVPEVRALTRCAAARNVARRYLQAEPELLECNLVVSGRENPNSVPRKGSQRQFHFDYAGWHSLNLFIYLTDVAEHSGAHQVVAGTHSARHTWDALRVAIPDQEIYDRFPDRVRTITGPAGTVFFEDTSAFHRRKVHTQRRVLLNILYASHRAWASRGRLTVKYADFLRSHPAIGRTLSGRSPA
jgi:hypothetical protein